jgi:proteasome lid subunit RPN8/RPN11
MIRIEPEAWRAMADHARGTYPEECCGAMVGSIDGDLKSVTQAVPLSNAFSGEKARRYEVRPEDLLAADREARGRGLELIGIFHSHPDEDAYFSETDLKNSCPWYSFVVISVKQGDVDHANSFLPNPDQTAADRETLEFPQETR